MDLAAACQPLHGGEFAFVKRLHEPGDQMVLGKHYADSGVDQGRAVLADLARHPVTAQHIAEKFARHFVADDPPPALVAKLAKTFLDIDLLESGLPKPGASESGWLNRTLAGLTPAGRVDPRGSRLFAVGPVTPLVVRGQAPVLSWSPQRVMPASDDTVQRLLALYRDCDAKLAGVLEDNTRLMMAGEQSGSRQKPGAPGPGQVRAYFSEAAGTAAKFLARPDGPRVGALALDGWDTHFNEGIAQGRLSQLLGALDEALAAIKTNMGSAWRETVVSLATEFGRTARINGTEGTDHGTATVTLLVGGALKGGRVIADWPGLKPADLYQNRDLMPTTDLRAVLKGVLCDHLRADEKALAQTVFPDSEAVKPTAGLVA